jgi:Flp pilus assembly protein TadG
MAHVRRRSDEGQELVEAAIVLPVLLLLLIGIMEFAIVILSYDTLANAAREGTRVGVIRSASDAEVLDAVLDRALTLGLNAGNVTISRNDSIVRVEVNYEVQLITGLIVQVLGGSPTIPLHTVATMRME